VPAYSQGKYLCELRSFLDDEALGEEIQAARSDRTYVLQDWAESMKKLQRHLPPIETNAAPIVRRGKSRKSKGEDQTSKDGSASETAGEKANPPSVPKLGTEDI
jgi:hypothetical protein